MLNRAFALSVISILFLIVTYSFLVNASDVKIHKPVGHDLVKNFGQIPVRFEENRGQFPDHIKFSLKSSGYTAFVTDKGLMVANQKNKKKPIYIKFYGASDQVAQGVEMVAGRANYFYGNDEKKWVRNIPLYKEVVANNIYSDIDVRYYRNGDLLEYDFVVQPGGNVSDVLLDVENADSIKINSSGSLEMKSGDKKLFQHKPIIYQMINDQKIMVKGSYEFVANDVVRFQTEKYDKSRPLIIDPVLELSTLIGGEDYEMITDVEVDSTGVYLAGNTNSIYFPTVNANQAGNAGGSYDAFVTKLSVGGDSIIYSTYLGGSEQDGTGKFLNVNGDTPSPGIAVSNSGEVFIAGVTDSSNDFPLVNAYQGTFGSGINNPNGSSDGFVAKLNEAGDELVFSTFIGGDGNDFLYGVALDNVGNPVVVGSSISESVDFPTTTGVIQESKPGSYDHDGVIAKFSTTGALLFSTYLGGNKQDYLYDIELDDQDNIYVAGKTNSKSILPILNAPQANRAGGYDLYIAKLNDVATTLNLGTYWGGSNKDIARGITLDNSGKIIVVGDTNSRNFPTQSPYQSSRGGNRDAVVVKMSDAGVVDFSTFLGGTKLEYGWKVDTDHQERIYVSGMTRSKNFLSVLPISEFNTNNTNKGGDAFITQLSSDGSSVPFSSKLGGNNVEHGLALRVTPLADIYIAGITKSYNFYTTPGALQSAPYGFDDAFLIKLASDNSTGVAPSISITSPASGAITSDSTPVIELSLIDNGSGVDFNSIEITVDGVLIAATCSDATTTATCTPNAPIADGNIIIAASVEDVTGLRSTLDQVTITIDTAVPVVTITNPVDNAFTNQAEYTVNGLINEVVQSLTVNSISVTPDAGNAFSQAVTLAEGANTISVIATDLVGNQTTEERTINLDTVEPEPIDLSSADISDIDNSQITVIGDAGAVEGNANVVITNTTTGQSITIVANADGSFNVQLASNDGDNVSIKVVDAAGNESNAINHTSIASNMLPVLTDIASQNITPGSTLTIQLQASDPDNASLTYSALPQPLPANASLNRQTGLFTFAPTSTQVGIIDFTFMVSDGIAIDSDTAQITVNAVNTSDPTVFTARLLDANSFDAGQTVPIVGATVSFLNTGVSGISDAQGNVTLSGLPPGEQILDFDNSTANNAPDGSPYAGFRERFVLDANVNNQVSRPFYLPRIDAGSLTTVNPNVTTMVVNASLGVELEVAANTAKDENGNDFTGQLSISLVPTNLAPAPLPEDLDPGMLITIQPVGVTFSTPAPITFPNIDDLPPGSEVDIWSLDPDAGQFIVVGIGMVSADGSEINTISGGIIAADWHAPLAPQTTASSTAAKNNQKCEDKRDSGSSVSSQNGCLETDVTLPAYYSQGKGRALEFIYKSDTANPTPILPFDLTIPVRGAVPPTVSFDAKIGGVDQDNEVFVSTTGLSEQQDETIMGSVAIDASMIETGIYPITIKSTSNYNVSRISTRNNIDTAIVNRKNSHFGSGWGLSGVSRLHVVDAANILLEEGDGNSTTFEPSTVTVFFTDFDQENNGVGQLDFDGFQDWNVTDGTVDLLGNGFEDELPGNGLYVDLDGTTNNAGRLETKQIFTLEPGTYLFEFDIAGNTVHSEPNTFIASLGGLFQETITINEDTPIAAYQRVIEVENTVSVPIAFDHQGGDIFGAYLLRVQLSRFSNEPTENPTGVSIEFDGIDDMLVAPGPVTPIDSHTIESWVKIGPNNGGDDSIMSRTPGPTTNCFTGMDLRARSTGEIRYVVDIAPCGAPTGVVSSGANLDNVGKWIHLAGSYDAATKIMKLYVNGELVAEKDSIEHDPATYQNVGAIYLDFFGFINRFDGQIDEVRYWDHARPQSAIQSTMRTSLTGTEVGLVSYWPLNENGGQLVNDLVTNGYDGVLGATTGVESSDPIWIASGAPIDTQGDDSLGVIFESPTGDYSALRRKLDGTYTRTMKNGTVYNFDANGLQTTMLDRNGNTTTYAYNINEQLETITDPVGKITTFNYSGDLLSSVTDPAGRVTSFTHDSNGNLIQVNYPDGSSQSFGYDAKHLMTSETSKRGFVTLREYDNFGRLLQTTLPDGAIRQATNAESMGVIDPLTGQGTEANPMPFMRPDQVQSTFIDGENHMRVVKTDVFGNAIEVTDANNLTTMYERDEDGNAIKVTRPDNSEITRTYDSNGNMLSSVEMFNNAETVSEYDSAYSLITSSTDPRGNITTYNRDEFGNLTTVVNDLAHTMTWSYLPNGLVNTRTDTNGVVTTYSYNADDLVQTMTETPPAGGGVTRVTQYEYDNAGNANKITTPDGVVIHMTYDAFNRRQTMENNLGEKVATFYDDEGNMAKSITMNPDATEIATLVQKYDPLNRLVETELPHDANTDVSIQRSYDLAGNMTSSTDAKNNSASVTFDDGNRLATETDRDNEITQYAYDNLNNIAEVVAPNGATTTYAYDSLSRQIIETSPDRGTWAYTYDLANNLKTVQDARGIVATYNYDDLNRATSIVYPDTTENITFTYDNCTFGVGRLCSRSDETGSYNYSYDAYGNVTQEVYVGDSTSFTTSYQYDEGHHLTQMTLPTGRVVTIARDAVQRIEGISAFVNSVSTPLVSNIQYDANNLITSRTYGNGLVDARNYDLQNRLLSQSLGGIDSVGYSYDFNGNITARNPSSITHSYDYDVLDRLIDDTLGSTSTDYSYDANHNRTLATQDSNSVAYSITNNSNQLASLDSASISYDANGNMINDGQGKTFAYNDANRLESITENSQVIAGYTYNAAGQRKTKVTPAGTTIYHYELGGNLISETTSAGSAIKDYVWQGNEPIAQIDVASTEQITYLHTDHLMTARLGTNTGGTITWRWESDAFGQATPEEDVDGNTINTSVNLRFPGQYYDAETNLHYNWNRYYDPSLGRYITSDPIGLSGGMNTYSYANQNALGFIDLLGLETTMVCRKVHDWRTDLIGGAKHCFVVVWHWEDDGCGNKKKVIDYQYSVAANRTPFQQGADTYTYKKDTEAFGSPGGDNEHYPIDPPEGWTQDQFDQSVTNSGQFYSSDKDYNSFFGPNSNTAADNIIEGAGGVTPDVPGAFHQNHGE